MLGLTGLGAYALGQGLPVTVTFAITQHVAGAGESSASIAAHPMGRTESKASTVLDFAGLAEFAAGSVAHVVGGIEAQASALTDVTLQAEALSSALVVTADTAALIEFGGSVAAHALVLAESSGSVALDRAMETEATTSAAAHVSAWAEVGASGASHRGAAIENASSAARDAGVTGEMQGGAGNHTAAQVEALSAAIITRDTAAPIEFGTSPATHAAGSISTASGVARHASAGIESLFGIFFDIGSTVSWLAGIVDHALSVLENYAAALVYSGTTYYCAAPLLAVEIGTGTYNDPFRTWYQPQRVLQPGDTLFVRGGTYGAKLYISASGSSDGYVNFVGDPNDRPLIRETSGHGCEIENGTNYVWVRGFDINTTDLLGSGFYNEAGPLYSHHLIVSDNIIHDCPSAGIQINRADYVAVINNVCFGNAKTSNLDTSGISVFQPANVFDYAPGYHIIVVGNLCYDNANYVPKPSAGTVTDGNGIILDDFDHVQGGFLSVYPKFLSKTLVANNICVNNGGSGIRNYMSSNVEIRNNIVWGNAQNPAGTRNADLMVHVYGGSYIVVDSNISVVNSVQGQYQYGRGGEEYSLDGTATGDIWTNNVFFSDASGVADECTSSPGFSFDSSNLILDPAFANPTRYSGLGTTYAQALIDFSPKQAGVVTPPTISPLPTWAQGLAAAIVALISDPFLISYSAARSLVSYSAARTLSSLSAARNLISRK